MQKCARATPVINFQLREDRRDPSNHRCLVSLLNWNSLEEEIYLVVFDYLSKFSLPVDYLKKFQRKVRSQNGK